MRRTILAFSLCIASAGIWRTAEAQQTSPRPQQPVGGQQSQPPQDPGAAQQPPQALPGTPSSGLNGAPGAVVQNHGASGRLAANPAVLWQQIGHLHRQIIALEIASLRADAQSSQGDNKQRAQDVDPDIARAQDAADRVAARNRKLSGDNAETRGNAESGQPSTSDRVIVLSGIPGRQQSEQLWQQIGELHQQIVAIEAANLGRQQPTAAGVGRPDDTNPAAAQPTREIGTLGQPSGAATGATAPNADPRRSQTPTQQNIPTGQGGAAVSPPQAQPPQFRSAPPAQNGAGSGQVELLWMQLARLQAHVVELELLQYQGGLPETSGATQPSAPPTTPPAGAPQVQH